MVQRWPEIYPILQKPIFYYLFILLRSSHLQIYFHSNNSFKKRIFFIYKKEDNMCVGHVFIPFFMLEKQKRMPTHTYNSAIIRYFNFKNDFLPLNFFCNGFHLKILNFSLFSILLGFWYISFLKFKICLYILKNIFIIMF